MSSVLDGSSSAIVQLLRIEVGSPFQMTGPQTAKTSLA